VATDLLDLYVKVKFDSSAFNAGMADAEKSFSKFGEKVKAGVATVAKVTAGAVAAGAAAVGKIVSDSVSAYGSYEQLVGGVQTLFGDSAAIVLKNSEKAFQTAGMSMNKYMETSIQSAAALINSLGGDQRKAAKLMDMSIRDMSDNVNKMGTTMEAVQNAYRGFSRGNFTMLDNLSLGFSGTKAGMEELLEKAEQISGIHYDISSYADIVNAIHEVQQAMGITGTTAEEAADTIQGSAGSMKAAWENLKVELVKDNGDISGSFDNVAASALTMFDNIEPKVEQAIQNLPALLDRVSTTINKMLPKLIPQVGSIIGAVGKSLLKSLPSLLDFGIDIMAMINKGLRSEGGQTSNFFSKLLKDITDRVPTIFRFGRRIMEAIIDGISKTDPTELGGSLQKVFSSALSNLTTLFDNIDWEQAGEWIAKALNSIDWDAIVTSVATLIGAVIQNSPDLLAGIAENVDWENLATLAALYFTPKFLKGVGVAIADTALWKTVTAGLSTQLSVSAGAAAGSAGLTLTAGLLAAIGGWKLGTWIRKKIGEEEIDKVVWEYCDQWKLGFDMICEAFNYVAGVLRLGWHNIQMGASEAIGNIIQRWMELIGTITKVIDKIVEVKDKITDGFNTANAYVTTVGAIKDSFLGRFLNGNGAGHHRAAGGIIINQPVYDKRGNLYGEAGREALLPLDSNTGWMDKLADRVNKDSGGVVVQNLYLTVEGGRIADDYDTERFIEKVAQKLGALNVKQERSVGGIGWT